MQNANQQIGQAIRNARKSGEYQIRAAVVKRLLEEGVGRKDIRIELNLRREDKMFVGRADIAVVLDECLICIELKSGRDRYDPDSLWEQCRSYTKSFDYVASVVDFTHFRVIEEGEYLRNNWCGSIRATYCHKKKRLFDCDRGKLYELDSFLDYILRFNPSMETNPRFMIELLTIEERCKLLGDYSYLENNRENMSLGLIRPFVVKALEERPLNKHEQRFWTRFNMEHGNGK